MYAFSYVRSAGNGLSPKVPLALALPNNSFETLLLMSDGRTRG